MEYSPGVLSPWFDDFIELFEGREPSQMPLSEEDKERIREIEQIRAEVQRESMKDQMLSPFGGPEIGKCRSCNRGLQLGWQFCPYCGETAAGRCPRCQYPTGGDPEYRFCPQCGGRIGGSA
jgi:hypothetical protein